MHIDITIHYKNENLALQQITIKVCNLKRYKTSLQLYMAKLR